MSNYLKYEQHLEQELVNALITNGIKASVSRDVEYLGASNVQVMLDYEGGLNDARQRIGTILEYDLHQGSMSIRVVTYREDKTKHFDRIALVRKTMLNQNNPFTAYYVFDIRPMGMETMEDEETNTDISTLMYEIKWKVDFNKI